jgi:hypothetical protein
VIVSLDGLSLAEFRASAWWLRPKGKPIKVVYHRRGMIHCGNFIVDAFDVPVAAVGAADAPVVAVPEDHTAPDAPAAAENDVAPDVPAAPVGPDTSDQLLSNNAGVFAQTFGRPIAPATDWTYGRPALYERGHNSAHAQQRDDPPRFPAGVDNWGAIGGPGDHLRPPMAPSQMPHVRQRDWYNK